MNSSRPPLRKDLAHHDFHHFRTYARFTVQPCPAGWTSSAFIEDRAPTCCSSNERKKLRDEALSTRVDTQSWKVCSLVDTTVEAGAASGRHGPRCGIRAVPGGRGFVVVLTDSGRSPGEMPASGISSPGSHLGSWRESVRRARLLGSGTVGRQSSPTADGMSHGPPGCPRAERAGWASGSAASSRARRALAPRRSGSCFLSMYR